MPKNSPVVLVTGCSDRGIGAALVTEFLKQGCQVYATARNLSSLRDCEAAGAVILELDITVKASIGAAVDKIVFDCGRVDVVVNNAGYALYGPMVEADTEEMRKIFETNVFGQLSVVQAVVPHMVSRGKGTIINIGSISGILTTPFAGPYCATKAALHAVSDALRMELKPFGIQVVTVCPGSVASNISSKSTGGELVSKDSLYWPVKEFVKKRAYASQVDATPSAVFARATVSVVLKHNPPAYFFFAKLSFLLPFIKKWIPVFVVDWILARIAGLGKLKKR